MLNPSPVFNQNLHGNENQRYKCSNLDAGKDFSFHQRVFERVAFIKGRHNFFRGSAGAVVVTDTR